MRLILCLLLTSCTGTYVRTPQWSVARLSVLSGHDVPTLTITRQGDVSLTGYHSKPDAQAVEAVTGGITRAITRP